MAARVEAAVGHRERVGTRTVERLEPLTFPCVRSQVRRMLHGTLGKRSRLVHAAWALLVRIANAELGVSLDCRSRGSRRLRRTTQPPSPCVAAGLARRHGEPSSEATELGAVAPSECARSVGVVTPHSPTVSVALHWRDMPPISKSPPCTPEFEYLAVVFKIERPQCNTGTLNESSMTDAWPKHYFASSTQWYNRSYSIWSISDFSF